MKRLTLACILAAVAVACDDTNTTTGSGGASTGTMSSSTNASGSTSVTTSTKSSADASSSTGLGGGLPGGPSSDRLTIHPKGTVAGADLGYFEYLPPHYGNGAKVPLLLFHHGIGESGDGSEAQVAKLFNTGLPTLIKDDQWPEDRPFIVLGTQHDAPPNTSCHSVKEIEDFTAFAVAHYDVDPAHVYITGLSCGAIGSWQYLGKHTNEVFAAAVLIAGDGKGAVNQAGCALGALPIWAFHGDMDGTVDKSGSIVPIDTLNACNPPPVDAKLTLYPGVGHNSWSQTYDLSSGNDIYAWMLSHTH